MLSLGRHKRWEEFDTQVEEDKQEVNERERIKKKNRKEKNRELKKQQNDVKFIVHKHEKKLMKERSTDNNVGDQSSDNVSDQEAVAVRQIGRKGYLDKDAPTSYRIKRSAFATEEEFVKKLNSTEVWVPPSQKVVATHYKHDKRHWDDYMLDPIMSKRKELQQEMIRINKM